MVAEKGKLKIRFKDPRSGRKVQRTLFEADSLELRKKAAAVAVAAAEKLRSGSRQQAEMGAESADAVTVERVALLYLRRAPGFPEEILQGRRSGYGGGVSGQVNKWYAAQPESVRKAATTPKVKSLWTDVYAFLRLFKDPRFARGRPVMDLEPGDVTQYVAAAPDDKVRRTRVNDTDRLSCAIRYVMQQHRKSVGLPFNPIEGRIVDRTKANVDAYDDRDRRKMLDALAKGEPGPESWQIRVILGIASSGRRIGSILALTAADHDLEANIVTWKAEFAKGEGYGRGDEVMPMTPLHREAVEWALANHPNPAGPDAPLVYQRDDTSKPFGAPAADKQLKRLEKAAGVESREGRAFHGFCRLAITAAADQFGDEAAAEYTGRKPETIRRYSYKKTIPKTMQRVADGLGKSNTELRRNAKPEE